MRFSNECGCTDDFEGVCRFEMNLNTKEQIRNALMIEDTGLMSVLSSSANPIYDFMSEVISPSCENIYPLCVCFESSNVSMFYYIMVSLFLKANAGDAFYIF